MVIVPRWLAVLAFGSRLWCRAAFVRAWRGLPKVVHLVAYDAIESCHGMFTTEYDLHDRVNGTLWR